MAYFLCGFNGSPLLVQHCEVGFNLLVDRTRKLLRSKSKVSRKDILANPRVSRLHWTVVPAMGLCGFGMFLQATIVVIML